MQRLEGKVALVTGAAKGMGESHARRLAKEGAKVIATDVDVTNGQRVADEIGDNALFLEHDVTHPDSWADVVDAGSKRFGPITVLVNNAGLTGPTAVIGELSTEDYRKTVSVDQDGVFYGMRAVLPGMVSTGTGSIINISSTAGLAHKPGTSSAAYTGAKFAVRGLSKTAAVEYGPHGIRVNTVLPGWVMTPLVEDLLSEAEIAEAISTLPARRMAELDEISSVVVFLASDEASYVSGADIVVDGAFTAE